MKLSARLLTVSCLLFCTEARSQTVVYSLTYSETRTSFQAHFANVSPFPGRRSDDRLTPNYQTERHLWVKDLASGEDKELFAAPPPKPPTSPEPNVTLSILGWINN